MTTPAPPHDVHVEAFLGGKWVDISQYVYQRSVMTISRGRTSETDTVQPGALNLVLDNRTGNFSPRNPNSPYFGQFGRNTPIRASVRQINDGFIRSVSSGWGTADTGQVWTTNEGSGGTVLASDWNTTGTTGTLNIPVAVASRLSYLGGSNEQYIDADVQADFSVPFTTVTGGSIQIGGIILRHQSSTVYYLVRCLVTTGGLVQLQITSFANASIVGVTTIAGVSNVGGQFLTVRGQIEDQTLRAKVWQTSSGEPKDWQISGVDASIGGTGSVGVQCAAGVGNTNVPFLATVDNFQMRHVRARMEISAYPQTWDQSGKDIYINLQAAGPLRRLNQGTTPTVSAPRLWIPAQSPIAYWSLEDFGTLTTAGQPVVGAFPFNHIGASPQKWAQGTLAAWLAPVVQGFSANAITSDGKFVGGVSHSGFVDRITIDYLVSGASSHAVYINVNQNPFSNLNWSLSFSDVSGNALFSPPVDATSGSVSAQAYVYSTDLYHIRWKIIDLGGGSNSWVVWVNGVALFSGTATGTGVGFLTRPPTSIEFDSFNGSAPGVGVSFGHIAAYYGDGPDLTTAVNVARGYPGEAAGTRIARLCASNNVAFTNVGNLAKTKPMGPQQAVDLLTLLTDAAVADGGILSEARGDLALTYRPLTAMYNESVAATLAVSGSHNLSGPLAPLDDDRFIKNDVTITRTGGAAQRITQPNGTLGTAAPPTGVGAYTDSATVNVLFDSDALQLAGWRIGLGTWDEARYPGIKTNFSTLPLTLRGAVVALNTGQRLQVTNPEAWLPPDIIDLLIQGTTENLSKFQWDTTITASPYGPYRVGLFDSATQGLLDTAGSQLTGGPYFAGATSLTVATTSGPIWIQGAVNFDIRVAGERMTVTNISGAASPQTFTVTRSVNGISKTQTAGTAVSLWQPFYLSY